MLNVSHPGRYGDLLWALPTVRTLVRTFGPVRLHLPVDPANTTPMIKMVNLLEKQEYIAEVIVRDDWSIEQEAPRRPFVPPSIPAYETERWEHLAYLEWPTAPLPFYTAQLGGLDPTIVDWSPWIHAEPLDRTYDVVWTFTDRWFELKAGLYIVCSPEWTPRRPTRRLIYAPGSRWTAEFPSGGAEMTIENLARAIAASRLVVTDCSMAHVLAVAMGTPVVVVEPEEARHHPIFWPGSVQDEKGHWKQADNHFGRLIYPVIGGDGKPTFDARHTADLIQERLRA